MTRKRYATVKMRLARHATVEGVYTFGPDLPGVRVLPRFYVLKDADPDARAWNLIDRGFEHPGYADYSDNRQEFEVDGAVIVGELTRWKSLKEIRGH